MLAAGLPEALGWDASRAACYLATLPGARGYDSGGYAALATRHQPLHTEYVPDEDSPGGL